MSDAALSPATEASRAESRRVVLTAVAACEAIGSAARHVDDVMTASFVELQFDSLAFMEFCIAIHAETGIELGVTAVTRMGSPGAVADYLARRVAA
jgi:acyl carrier protein